MLLVVGWMSETPPYSGKNEGMGRAHPGCLFGPDLQFVIYVFIFLLFLHSTVVIPWYVLELVLRSWIGCFSSIYISWLALNTIPIIQ